MAIKLSGSTIIDDSRNIVNAGIVTATSFDGDGSNLTNIVTSIVAGTNVTVSNVGGVYTVNSTATGEGGSSTFLGLTDTPASFTASKFLAVNSGGTAVEFVDAPSGGGISLSDLSVGPLGSASGSGSLSYNSSTGAFTYTPPDLSSYLTSVTANNLSAISIDALSDVDTSSTAPTEGQALLWSSTNSKWEPGTVSSGGGGTTTFLGLTDTPASFTASKFLAVNSGGTAVEFVDAPSGGSSTFTGLSDTPASMGTAGQYLAVNSGGTALEFVAAPSGGGGTSLTVQTRNGSSGAEGNEATEITKLTFNSASGFSVSEPNAGEAFISLGSAFAPWSVAGQTTLTPEGEEEIEFIAGSGITITTNNTSTPKSITFTSSGGGGGGASSLGDLTDVDLTTTAPTSGKFLKYDGTKWVPATVPSGGGGGGGDGTALLGIPPDGTYEGGLIGMSEETQINDAIDLINTILVKVAPPAPPSLSLKTSSTPMVLSPAPYSAYQTGTDLLRTDVTNLTKPVTAVISSFYDGDAGTLSFEVDGQEVGSRILSTENDTGTYGNGSLVITADVDPYANDRPGFWKALSAKGTTPIDLGVGQEHTYQMKHSNTGNSNLLTFFVDNPGSPTVADTSVDVATAAGDLNYISGVPSYKANSPIYVSTTINGAITKTYSSTKIADVTGTQITTKNIAPAAAPTGYTEGGPATFTAQEVLLKNSVFSDSDFTITVKGYNSKGDSGTGSPITVPGRIDTLSNESARLTSGSGQYPGSGYGDSYDSTQSLAANEELQLINGKYEYPSTDYSSILSGPNYSALSGTRYVIFKAAGPSNRESCKITITATGLSQVSTLQPWKVKDNNGPIVIQFKLDGAGGSDHWYDGNAAFSATAASANGVGTLNVSSWESAGSSLLTRTLSFPAPNYFTCPDAYIRIGLSAGSTAKITSATLVYT